MELVSIHFHEKCFSFSQVVFSSAKCQELQELQEGWEELQGHQEHQDNLVSNLTRGTSLILDFPINPVNPVNLVCPVRGLRVAKWQ